MKFLFSVLFGIGALFLLIVISCIINRKTENTQQVMATTIVCMTFLIMFLFYEVIA